MTDLAHEMHEAEASVADAKLELKAQVAALKSKASGVLASPYVRGGVALGAAAAGYALVKHKQAAPHARHALHDTPAKRGRDFGDVLKVCSFLLSVASSFGAAPNKKEVHAPVARNKEAESVPTRLENDGQDATATPPARQEASATSSPVIEKPAASFLGRQWQIIKAAAMAWIDDFAPSMGAALSYYTLFSLAPLLVIVIAIAGLVFGQDAAQGAIIAQLSGIMGEQGATAVQGLLKAAREPSTGIIASIVGGLLLLLGSTAIFAELQSDLDRIWRAPVKKDQSGLWSWLRSRVLSFGLILGLAFMLMVSLVVSAALAATGDWMSGGGEATSVIASILNFIVSLGIFTVLFAMIYKIMPNVKISWHDVWIGAAVTALLFNVGKSLIGLYLAKSNVASGFGAAGSFVILIAWFYYSAQIFLFGAEYTWVYANSKKQQG